MYAALPPDQQAALAAMPPERQAVTLHQLAVARQTLQPQQSHHNPPQQPRWSQQQE